MYSKHIVIDLEMNPLKDPIHAEKMTLFREVIEIGAVMLSDQAETLDSFDKHVKPELNPGIEQRITDLTGIGNYDVGNADNFADALSALEKWIGPPEGVRIYSWSNSDLLQLQAECAVKKIPFPENLNHWVNFQPIYQRMIGTGKSGRQLSLRSAAESLGIWMDKKRSHSALYDAQITAELVKLALTGEYRKQAEMLEKSKRRERTESVFSLGDQMGGALSKMLEQLKNDEES